MCGLSWRPAIDAYAPVTTEAIGATLLRGVLHRRPRSQQQYKAEQEGAQQEGEAAPRHPPRAEAPAAMGRIPPQRVECIPEARGRGWNEWRRGVGRVEFHWKEWGEPAESGRRKEEWGRPAHMRRAPRGGRAARAPRRGRDARRRFRRQQRGGGGRLVGRRRGGGQHRIGIGEKVGAPPLASMLEERHQCHAGGTIDAARGLRRPRRTRA
eukprot:gene12941-biopygen4368